MTFTTQPNPFYAGRKSQLIPIVFNQTLQQPVYAKLPRIPITTSPVPGLTSLYHNAEAGNYGSRTYPGKCGGLLIRDLLLYFKPAQVCDPMSGSGTCKDVCDELGIPCVSLDIHRGQDACDPNGFTEENSVEFIWAHPPYWRQKLYAADERDLSRTSSLDAFLEGYERFIRNGAKALQPGGHLVILMGDYRDRYEGFVPLTFHTKRLALEVGLKQACTDIIRFSHGASSGRKVYRSSFIPGLHDTCMIFRK